MIVEFDARNLAPFEIAARIDALLAEPCVSPKRHAALVRRLCNDQIAVALEAHNGRRAELQARYPQYDPAIDRTQTLALQGKREDAFRFGALVLALVAETALGRPAQLPLGCRSVSLDQMIPALWPRERDEDEDAYHTRVHNIERLKVRARYPVAHLAAAMQWAARELHAGAGKAVWDYQDLGFLRNLIAQACHFAGLIRATAGLENMAIRLIELRWIEDDEAVPA